MRGSGDSTGFYYDEYLPQEQQDACEIIRKIILVGVLFQNWFTNSITS